MDKERIAHDLALIAAKTKIDSQLPPYKVLGSAKLVSDLLEDYIRAKEQIMDELKNNE